MMTAAAAQDDDEVVVNLYCTSQEKMLRWGCLLLLHPAFARASYSYSYVSTVDEPVGTKKNSTARGEKKYRGFESFKYPPREDPDVTVCKEIKQLTTDCMRAYNCTGDDDAPAAAFEASPLEYNDKGQVSACAAARTSAAFWKDCHGQLTAAPTASLSSMTTWNASTRSSWTSTGTASASSSATASTAPPRVARADDSRRWAASCSSCCSDS